MLHLKWDRYCIYPIYSFCFHIPCFIDKSTRRVTGDIYWQSSRFWRQQKEPTLLQSWSVDTFQLFWWEYEIFCLSVWLFTLTMFTYDLNLLKYKFSLLSIWLIYTINNSSFCDSLDLKNQFSFVWFQRY